MNVTFPVAEIADLIPQKVPFVMVDTLLDFTKTHLKSSFTILPENLFIENNHFQEPGLVENMAQTVALHTGFDYFLRNEPAPTGYIGSIKKVEVFELPKIGDTITTKAKILHEFMGVTMVEVVVYDVSHNEIAKAQMKTVIAS